MTGASPGRREPLTALLVGALLVIVLTYPTVTSPATYGRVDTSDGRYSIWNIGWVDHALLTDPRHWLDANIFYPHTGTLAYSELNLVAGTLGLPVFAASQNAIAALNAAVALGLLLSFLLTWALVRHLTASSGAGLCAATAFTFCPFVQAHTAHIQLLMVFVFPLVALAFQRFRDRSSVVRASALGAALAIAGLACAYYGIFAGLMLGVLAVALARAGMRYRVGLAGAAVVTLAVVAPIFVAYLHARGGAGVSLGVSAGELRDYSATPLSYVTSPGFIHETVRDAFHLFTPAPESIFPGVLLLGLAVVGAVEVLRRGGEDRRTGLAYAAAGVLALWASFGPAGGLYTLLMHVIPAMNLLRAPVRLGVVVTFALAVLAGYGVRRLSTRRPWLPVVLVPLLAMEVATLPWPLVPAGPVPEAYRILAQSPAGAVVEFPFMYKRTDYHNHSKYMFLSTYHWHPLVNGYSDVIPADFTAMSAPGADGHSLINDFPDPASFDLLRRLGVRYVIFHLDPRSYDAPSRAKILARFPPYDRQLRRMTTNQDTWLFEISAQ